MSPASSFPQNPKQFPAATLDDQEDIAMTDGSERTVMQAPPFSSPDPSTDAQKMLPLEDGTSAHMAALEAAEARDVRSVSDYKAMKSADLKSLAAERDLDVQGTGKSGGVTRADYEKALVEDDASDYNASDFKNAVQSTQTQDELDAVCNAYEQSGKSYKSVDAAIEAKQAEFNGDEEPDDDSDSMPVESTDAGDTSGSPVIFPGNDQQ